jgi:hypothetical protein
MEAPAQAKRVEFYAKQLGCLVLADRKHKRMGWRTGRAFHALLAGCPAIVEEDHLALNCFPKFKTAAEVHMYFERWQQPHEREIAWHQQMLQIKEDRAIAEETLQECGL